MARLLFSVVVQWFMMVSPVGLEPTAPRLKVHPVNSKSRWLRAPATNDPILPPGLRSLDGERTFVGSLGAKIRGALAGHEILGAATLLCANPRKRGSVRVRLRETVCELSARRAGDRIQDTDCGDRVAERGHIGG
jgi:hypothetical protein